MEEIEISGMVFDNCAIFCHCIINYIVFSFLGANQPRFLFDAGMLGRKVLEMHPRD